MQAKAFTEKRFSEKKNLCKKEKKKEKVVRGKNKFTKIILLTRKKIFNVLHKGQDKGEGGGWEREQRV